MVKAAVKTVPLSRRFAEERARGETGRQAGQEEPPPAQRAGATRAEWVQGAADRSQGCGGLAAHCSPAPSLPAEARWAPQAAPAPVGGAGVVMLGGGARVVLH